MTAGASLGEAEAVGSAGTVLAAFGAWIAAAARNLVAELLVPAILLVSALPARRRPGPPLPAFAR